MKYLYLDNFRGFRNAVIPLYDVNFLVGENSTGKTSVLSLIALIQSSQFWFSSGVSFNSSESRLGHFFDLVSVGSSDKSYFRIGLISDVALVDEPSQGSILGNDDAVFGFLMTFVSKKGLPALRKLTYTRAGEAIHVVFDKASVRWQIAAMGLDNLTVSNGPDLFAGWRDVHDKAAIGYATLAMPDIGGPHDLFDIMLSVNRELNRKHKTKRRLNIFGFNEEVVWLAPIRTKPRRTYDDPVTAYSSEGEHTPYLIRQILDRPKEKARFNRFIEAIGVDSGLFEGIAVKRFGKTNTSPFELDIVLGGQPLSITNVGYGVSQSLPLIVELFFRANKTSFVMQQPEVHLHPRAQAAFGDVIFKLAQKDKKTFYIETHSDFTIDRFRLNHRDEAGEIPRSQVLFFERTVDGNRATAIDIESTGQYSEAQPPAFREFFFREDMRLLEL